MKNSIKKGWRRWHAEGVTDEESDFEEIKIVRTELSNVNQIIVHFFDTRQRNEPKKTRVRALPLRIPLVVACYTQKRSRVFAKRTRF